MKQLLFASLIALSLVSCVDYQPTADEKDRQQQEKALQEAQRETGLPAVHNFQEKKLLKQIYELRDNEKIVNYAYLYNEMQGKLVFLGKCIGYGIPYSTQYSNPKKRTNCNMQVFSLNKCFLNKKFSDTGFIEEFLYPVKTKKLIAAFTLIIHVTRF